MSLESVPHEWFWQALRDGQHKLVMNLVPLDFDWNSLHPIYGTPLMSTVHEMIVLNGGEPEQTHLDDMVRWCMKMGADPRETASEAIGLSVGGFPPHPPGPGWTKYRDKYKDATWWHYEGPLGKFHTLDDDEKHIVEYDYSKREHVSHPRLCIQAERHTGHSAITLAIAIKQKLLSAGLDRLLKRANHLLELFAEFTLQSIGPRMQIDRRVIYTWAKALEDTSHADVEFLLEPAGDRPVVAHANILCSASPVLKAALQSGMREGTSKQITVQGVNATSIQLVLAHMYTGCFEGSGESIDEQLRALDLAHRWQLDHTVEALERDLVAFVRKRLQSSSVEDQLMHVSDLYEAAKLKQLTMLGTACCEYVNKAPPDIKKKLCHSLQIGCRTQTEVERATKRFRSV